MIYRYNIYRYNINIILICNENKRPSPAKCKGNNKQALAHIERQQLFQRNIQQYTTHYSFH